MEILFLILKIIGILLAVLIFLVVALIAVPVRYSVNLKVQKEAEGRAVFSWLLHLVDFRIWYEQKEINYKLRILGISISLDRQKAEKPVKKEKTQNSSSRKRKRAKKISKEKVSETTQSVDIIENSKKKNGQERPQAGNMEESIQNKKEKGKLREEKISEELHDEVRLPVERVENGAGQYFENIHSSKKKKSLGKRLQELWHIVRAFFQKLRQRIKEIKNRTTTLKEQFTNIKKLLSEETNKSALLHLLQELKYLLRHYSPRKASGNLNFGMEDPAQTGQMLGLLSVLPFWTRYKISVLPDFTAEAFYVKGTLCMKGHIRIWHLLVSGFRLIKDKNIRKLITKIRE